MGWRKWGLRFLMAILAPLLFLGLVEGGLRLFGYGYSTNFFVKNETTNTYIPNEKFSRRFYSPKVAKDPLPFSIASPKVEGVFRIFVLGSSAAWGTPSPSCSFSRILSVMLRGQYPDVKFEVINTAIMGVNSHIVLPIARDCASHQPDLFIVYLGNNEVIGFHGAKTHSSDSIPSLSFIRGSLWVKSTRTGQLLASLIDSPDSDDGAARPQDMEYFRNHRAASDDPERLQVYENFRANMADICDVAGECGAGMLVATVAVNLRDSPPFGSLHRDDLTFAELARWEAAYSSGVEAERFQRYPQAVRHYLDAMKIDDRFADLHFRLGRQYLTLGRFDEARKHYILARDLDAMSGRADTPINQSIRQVVASKRRKGVELVDLERAIAQCDLCEHEIPGGNLFYEHVHLKFAGNYELARALLPAVARSVRRKHPDIQAPKTPIPSMRQCADPLGFTRWRRLQMLEPMVELTSRPPFTGQIEHEQRQGRAVKTLNDLQGALGKSDLKDAIEACRKAIAISPDDWLLHFDIAGLYDTSGDFQAAADHLKIVLQKLPWYSEARLALGHVLAKARRNEEALAAYREVLRARPEDHAAHNGMGVVLARQEKFDLATDHFNEALRIKPGDKEALEGLQIVKGLMEK